MVSVSQAHLSICLKKSRVGVDESKKDEPHSLLSMFAVIVLLYICLLCLLYSFAVFVCFSGADPEQGPERSDVLCSGGRLLHGVPSPRPLREAAFGRSHRELPRPSVSPGRARTPGNVRAPTVTFTSRRFNPKRLTISTFVKRKRSNNISLLVQ